MRFLFIVVVFLYLCACSWQVKDSSAPQRIGQLALNTLPALIVEDIKEVVAKSDWSFGCAAFTKITYKSFEFADKSHLMIAEAPDYLCDQSNTYIPIHYVEGELFGWGGAYPGKVNHVVKSENGHWFLSSYWAVEGVYPMLYQSADGVVWNKVRLPENRAHDCCHEQIETLRITKDEANKEYLAIRFFNGNALDSFEWMAHVDEASQHDAPISWQQR